MRQSLIYPLFGMAFWSLIIAILNIGIRYVAVKKGQIKMDYFQMFAQGSPPEYVAKFKAHLANLFEIPVLFYAACLLGLFLQTHDYLSCLFAWLFVCGRIIHSLIHIGPNIVMLRFGAYFFSLVMLIGVWIRLFALAMRTV